MPLTGLELQTSAIGSDRSTNWATTYALLIVSLSLFLSLSLFCPPFLFHFRISFSTGSWKFQLAEGRKESKNFKNAKNKEAINFRMRTQRLNFEGLAYSWNILLNGPFLASFYLFSSFQYSWHNIHIKFADEWIRTTDLLCQKRPLPTTFETFT